MVSGTDDGVENRVGKIYDALVSKKDSGIKALVEEFPQVQELEEKFDKGWFRGKSNSVGGVFSISLGDGYSTLGRAYMDKDLLADSWKIKIAQGINHELSLEVSVLPNGAPLPFSEYIGLNFNLYWDVPTGKGRRETRFSLGNIVSNPPKADIYNSALMSFSDLRGYAFVRPEHGGGAGYISSEEKDGTFRPKYQFRDEHGVLKVGLYAASGLFEEAGDLLVEIDREFTLNGKEGQYSVVMFNRSDKGTGRYY
jgi:hypothetical protein